MHGQNHLFIQINRDELKLLLELTPAGGRTSVTVLKFLFFKILLSAHVFFLEGD